MRPQFLGVESFRTDHGRPDFLDACLPGRDENSRLTHALEGGQHGLDALSGDFLATYIEDIVLAT
jgi:hypothetical protein